MVCLAIAVAWSCACRAIPEGVVRKYRGEPRSAAASAHCLGLCLQSNVGGGGEGIQGRLRPAPLLQWCLRVGVSRCGPAAVVGRGC